MLETKTASTIDFKPITPEGKPLYDAYLAKERERGCEFSFANLCLWGRQSLAEVAGHIALFSQFDRRSVYPYPLGEGDKREVLDAIIKDAAARGIPCRITGIGKTARETIERLYPDRFRFHCDRGSFDYVYDINDLAELRGKRYNGKRNHLNRFRDAFPDYRAEPLSDENLDAVRAMAEEWYERRLAENPESDFLMERAALTKALRYYEQLEMDGLVLLDGDRVLGFTLGSRLSRDTFDVQFEKALWDVNGAYAAVNYEFARYLRDRYPTLLYLDREEDMGLLGLRRAKESYYPHHMVEKCWACLLEDGYDY